MKKYCVVCGREFEGHANRKFCGDECRRKAVNARMNKRYHDMRKQQPERICICEICGKPIVDPRGNQKIHDLCMIEDVMRTLRSGKKVQPAQRNRLQKKGIPISEIRAAL